MILPEKAVLRASQWCYEGIWGFITRWLHVPKEPPQLTGADDQSISSFRPAEGFLRYLKFFFWFGLVAFDGALFVMWIALLFAVPLVGILLALPIWAIMIIPDIVAYIAIHLRYDTTWYVLSDRSMRIRRGIWKIHETTITYENIQNVAIRQGPLQRYFGISDVVVETAGGGSSTAEGQTDSSHSGRLEGIGNAAEVRDLIMSKWQASRASGLGDEESPVPLSAATGGFRMRHAELLEEVRDLAVQLAKMP